MANQMSTEDDLPNSNLPPMEDSEEEEIRVIKPTINGLHHRTVNKRGVTDLQLIDFTYSWEINNFQDSLERNLMLFNSPVFTADDNDRIEWQLCMYPGHSAIDVDKFFTMYVCLAKKEFKALNKSVRITVTLVNVSEGENIVHEILLKRIELHQQERTIKNFVDAPILLDESKGFISPTGSINIVCTVCFGIEIYSYSKPPQVSIVDDTENRSPKNNLIQDFERLLEIGKFSDAKIRVCDKEIKVHKNILWTRSRFFASVFDAKMDSESAESRVIVVDDVELDIVKEMLRFIYGGEIKNLKSRKSDFLAAAHKYGINGLKSVCEDELIDNLCVHNIGEMLVLADCYDAKKLKATVIEFLSQHTQTVINMQPFMTLIKLLSAPMLAEVVTTLMLKDI